MKSFRSISFLAGVIFQFQAVCIEAQSYSIDWFTVDGGGGTSVGGTYSVSGTIGQPDAGMMNGGAYQLTGGFWSVISVVQSPEASKLRIVLTTTNTVVIAWPTSGPYLGIERWETGAFLFASKCKSTLLLPFRV